MDTFITIVVFILIFSLLILIHEFGHYFAAKRAGIKVEEFGIGLPPRIWGKKKGETIYSINLIPFGGFVRMLGEDSSDKKALKDKRSFAAQSMRARAKVIVAGVFMNFLLAWILLTVTLSFGMQPLLLPDEVLPAIHDGKIVVKEGVKILEVEENGIASEFGLKSGDIIYSLNGQPLDDVQAFEEAQKSPIGNSIGVLQGGGRNWLTVDESFVKAGFNFELDDFGVLPRIRIYEVKKGGLADKAGIKAGDYIITLNGGEVFTVDEYQEILKRSLTLGYEVYRDGKRYNMTLHPANTGDILITQVFKDSPAEKSGFKDGDIISKVNDQFVQADVSSLIYLIQTNDKKNMTFTVERDGKEMKIAVVPVNKKIGIALSELVYDGEDLGMTIYDSQLISHVEKVDEVKYPFYQAAYKSLEEGYKMSKVTAELFFDFVGGLISRGEVSENVAGPLGIYQMTGVFVAEGFIPLIRFVAILSLSLAVLNILPLPALDGGRLLFIIFELLLGHKLSERFESLVHGFGYFLLLILILIVSYSDIIRLINS